MIRQEPSSEYLALGQLNKLLIDPVLVKVVTIVDLASLSILELLELNLTHHEINYALTKEVIMFDKEARFNPESTATPIDPTKGDYHYSYLNSKVKLTQLGIYMLETLKSASSEPEEQTPVMPPTENQDRLLHL